MTEDVRRPLKSRSTAWARAVAQRLASSQITPNQISLASVVFAALGAFFLLSQREPIALVIAAVCIQLRLLCNLIDGMVAIEGAKGTPVGALYNEIPDRIADSLFLIAAGYGCGYPTLGWFCALAAAVTAYIRVLGGSLGLPQDFRGPQSKPQRMAVLTVACLAGALETAVFNSQWSILTIGLWIIAIGSVLTCVMRTRAIAIQLRARQTPQVGSSRA